MILTYGFIDLANSIAGIRSVSPETIAITSISGFEASSIIFEAMATSVFFSSFDKIRYSFFLVPLLFFNIKDLHV